MEIEKDLNTDPLAGHWKKFIHDTYVGSADLMTDDGSYRTAVVTIKAVHKRKIYNKGTKGLQDCVVITFESGGKAFIANLTNLDAIEKIAKTELVQKWAGTRIMLTVENVNVGREMKPAIRVKPPKE